MKRIPELTILEPKFKVVHLNQAYYVTRLSLLNIQLAVKRGEIKNVQVMGENNEWGHIRDDGKITVELMSTNETHAYADSTILFELL